MEAESIRQAAQIQERQARRRATLLMGQTQATSAASGLDLSTGSPLFTALDNARQAEIEALNIRRSGALGAMGKSYEASLAESTIPGTIVGGVAQGAGTVLSSWMQSRGLRTGFYRY